MCNDIEILINIIYTTNVMKNLFEKNFDEYLKCIEQTQYWNKIKNIDELLNRKNIYIIEAVKEVLETDKFISIIKCSTKLDIEKIRKMVKKEN